jgi:hypothetical protein
MEAYADIEQIACIAGCAPERIHAAIQSEMTHSGAREADAIRWVRARVMRGLPPEGTTPEEATRIRFRDHAGTLDVPALTRTDPLD